MRTIKLSRWDCLCLLGSSDVKLVDDWRCFKVKRWEQLVRRMVGTTIRHLYVLGKPNLLSFNYILSLFHYYLQSGLAPQHLHQLLYSTIGFGQLLFQSPILLLENLIVNFIHSLSFFSRLYSILPFTCC